MTSFLEHIAEDIIDRLKNIEVEAGIAKYPKLFKIEPIIPDKEINKK